MCGIVGAVSSRDIVGLLIQGLQRLEYRGYDSCGVAVHTGRGLARVRGIARVADLARQAQAENLHGCTGIAHTRWATHGAPAIDNAHPHFSMGPLAQTGDDAQGRVTLVHNGISKTMKSCARAFRPGATASSARPTPKSSSTSSTASTRAICLKPCRPPAPTCAAATPSPCCTAMNPIA